MEGASRARAGLFCFGIKAKKNAPHSARGAKRLSCQESILFILFLIGSFMVLIGHL
jgi:hypothetical protein